MWRPKSATCGIAACSSAAGLRAVRHTSAAPPPSAASPRASRYSNCRSPSPRPFRPDALRVQRNQQAALFQKPPPSASARSGSSKARTARMPPPRRRTHLQNPSPAIHDAEIDALLSGQVARRRIESSRGAVDANDGMTQPRQQNCRKPLSCAISAPAAAFPAAAARPETPATAPRPRRTAPPARSEASPSAAAFQKSTSSRCIEPRSSLPIYPNPRRVSTQGRPRRIFDTESYKLILDSILCA
jgi:hypothetical protein